MDTNVFLAQLWGWLLLIVSLIFLLRGPRFILDTLKAVEPGARGVTLSLGYVSLVLGLATLILSQPSASTLNVVIVVLGGLAVLKGINLLAFSVVINKNYIPYLSARIKFVQAGMLLILALAVGLIVVSFS